MNDILSMPNASKVAIVGLKTLFMSKLLSVNLQITLNYY